MELTKQQFIDRFTHPEFIGILNAAKTDVDVEAWLFRFNNADNPILTTDPRTIQGVESFVVKQLITQQRAEEILGTTLTWDGWHVGQMVTILPPFNTAYPDQYPIEALDPVAGVITVSGTGFDPMYVQAV
jgi:hypothetical protein